MKLTWILICAIGLTVSTKTFGAEPCDPMDIFSPCFDPGAMVDEGPSPGPDVGSGPGAPGDCDPTDIFASCYDPSIWPEEPHSPGKEVSDPPIDLTDPSVRSPTTKPPLSRNWLDSLLEGAAKAGGGILDALDGEGGTSGGGSGGGTSGGGSGSGAGSGEGETDNKQLATWLLIGAGVLAFSGVLK